MTSPEAALERARREADAGRAAGAYDERTPSLDVSPVTHITKTRLVEWSLIDPRLDRVYSTRRLGAPITVTKRLLIRALRQYFGEWIGQQSRYNAQATAHIINLEDRVRDLEDQLRTLSKAVPGAPGGAAPGRQPG